MCAAEDGHVDIVRLLLQAKARADAVGMHDSQTALRYVRLLLQAGVDVNSDDAASAARSALVLAAGVPDNLAVVLDLLPTKAAVDQQSYTSPLLKAAETRRNAPIVAALLGAKASVHDTDMNEQTPLICAMDNSCRASSNRFDTSV